MTFPKQGIMLPRDLPHADLRRFAAAAEDAGFDELWVVEDLGFRGGVAQAAIALGATGRVRVGVGILPAAVRDVAFAAMEVATLAQVFPGRLDVGVGHGVPGWLRAVGAWPARPLRHLESHTTALRALLRGEAVRLGEGEPFALDPTAVPEHVPDVLLGVRGPKSLALSGRVADGTVLAEPATPEYVRSSLARIAATRPHRIVTYNAAAVGDTTDAALATVRPGLQWIGDSDWEPHLAPLDFADEFRAFRAAASDRADFADRMPEEWVARLSLAGTAAQVRERVAALGEAGATSSVMIPVGPDPFAAIASLSAALAAPSS